LELKSVEKSPAHSRAIVTWCVIQRDWIMAGSDKVK
jgi:hypothetical protein